MRKEKPGLKSENFDSVKNLNPETKIKMILEVFDLGKDREQNKNRKANFIKLIEKYHQEVVLHHASKTPGSNVTSSEINEISSSHKDKKYFHDQILEILRTMSLSLGLNKDQRLLAEYLARNRDEVEKLVIYYFTGKDETRSKSVYLNTKQDIDSINDKMGPEEE